MNINKDYHLIKKALLDVFRRWYFFGAALILCISLAFLYVRYSQKIYRTSSSILVRNQDNKKVGAENIIQGLELFATSENIENQISIITSYGIIRKTILDLDINVVYYAQGNVQLNEIYKEVPFIVQYDSVYPQALEVPFSVSIIDDNSYKLTVEGTKYKSYDLLSHKELDQPWEIESHERTYNFDSTVRTKSFSFILKRTRINYKSIYKTDDYVFKLRDIDKITREVKRGLTAKATHKWSSVIKLTMDSHVPEKTIDLLNGLADNYLSQDVYEKNEIAVSTMKFIDQQLILVTKDLFSTESKLENYKTDNNFLNLEASSNNLLKDVTNLQKERAKLILQKKYYDYLLEYINNNQNSMKVMAPSISGIENELLIRKIDELNELISKKSELSYGVKEDNPSIAVLNLKVENLKKVIVENIVNIASTSKIKKNDIEERIAALNGTIRRLPKNERELINMQRSFNLNNNLYNYLLEKKAEAGIAKAANKSDHKILDRARLETYYPISPNTNMVFIAAMIISVVISYLLIILIKIFDAKIRNMEQITTGTIVPVLGSIAQSNGSYLPLIHNPKSLVSESFRSLRVNLQYTNSNFDSKVLGVTSSTSGEGKSFCAINLATSLSFTNVKVLLIDADLRRPCIGPSLSIKSTSGLSNYLIGKGDFEEIVNKSSVENLDVIVSGYTPPNPSEIMGSELMSKLIVEAKKNYDYVIIDAPPIGVVSDYMVLSPLIEAHLFVMRCNFSELNSINFVNELVKDESYKNLYIVLNEDGNGGYGYKGYGGESDYYEV